MPPWPRDIMPASQPPFFLPVNTPLILVLVWMIHRMRTESCLAIMSPAPGLALVGGQTIPNLPDLSSTREIISKPTTLLFCSTTPLVISCMDVIHDMWTESCLAILPPPPPIHRTWTESCLAIMPPPLVLLLFGPNNTQFARPESLSQ